MNQQTNSRAFDLLNKVYDELDKVDVSTLSMRELGDFLEVVQKGRFLESFGASPYGNYGAAMPCCTTATDGNE